MVKRHTKHEDGTYHINGKSYEELVGSRAKVGHGTAHHTTGGLTAADLHHNKRTGRWVSLKKSRSAKKNNNLEKHGWSLASKGSFGATQKTGGRSRRGKKRTRRR
jgi:hypothetical protein